jgi:hypothetical protein
LRNIKKKCILILLITIPIFVIGGMYLNNFIEKNKKNNNYKIKSVQFGCELLDDGELVFHKTFINENTFNGDFIISSRSNVDVEYQIILLNNYKQVNFEINKNKSETSQTIFIPQSEKEFLDTKINITASLEDGINDFLLVFIEKSKNQSSSKNNLVFSKRFTATNNSMNQDKYSINSSDEIEIINSIFNLSIALNTELRVDTNEYIPNKQIAIPNNKNGLTKIPIAINLQNSIYGSPFYDQYLEDAKKNKEQIITIIAISDGRLIPLYYSNGNKDYKLFYNVKLGETVLISPLLNKSDLDNNQNIYFFVLTYPYESLDNLLGTYKATNWSTVLNDTINAKLE